MNMSGQMQPTTTAQPSGVLSKQMSLGGSQMKHGAMLKTMVVGLFVVILIIVTAVISYGVGYNVAMEDSVATNTPTNKQPTNTTLQHEPINTFPGTDDFMPVSYGNDMLLNSDVPDNMM